MNAPAALVENAPMARAIVGPWVHQYPHTAVPGPRIDFLGEMKRWWDRWLKGIDNGADAVPPYRAYLMSSTARPDASASHRPGYWVGTALPSPQVRPRAYALGADRILGGFGPIHEEIRTRQTLGADAGEFFPMGLNAEMAGDQRHDDALSLCFDETFHEGLTIFGAAELTATLSADQPFGFLVARLCDVAPDGASTRIAHGVLNLRHRTDPPSPLTPGAPVTVTLTLDQCAYWLAPGHRLRLALSNSYWPWVWPSPAPVILTLTGGALTVPLVEGALPEVTFDSPDSPPPLRLHTLSPGVETRRRAIDMITGVETITVTSDSGETRNPDHGLATRATMVETWAIHPDDPLSASCDIEWTQRFTRGDWSVETEVRACQRCDAEAIILDARLVARIKDGPEAPEIIERSFAARVARREI